MDPLSATWLDAYSLAYTVASLLNQRFGKGKEPFWQQAYTNLVRWIIELYRVLPGGWVTLRDVYHCAIDKGRFHLYRVTQVELAASVITAIHQPPKNVTIRLTHPNACSLPYDDLDLTLRAMLHASGIEPTRPPDAEAPAG